MANDLGNSTQPGRQHPMTDESGLVHYLDEDSFYSDFLYNLEVSGLTDQPFHPVTFIPHGTDEEKHNIINAILARANSENIDIAIWYQPDVVADANYSPPTFPVRQSDGSFRQETLEAIVGGLITQRFDTLETQGTITEQRAFFGIVRAFIETVSVETGHDVTQQGAVIYKESWETGALATLDSLEEAFESLVLENMRPAAEEDDLVKGLNGMDVD